MCALYIDLIKLACVRTPQHKRDRAVFSVEDNFVLICVMRMHNVQIGNGKLIVVFFFFHIDFVARLCVVVICTVICSAREHELY